MIQGIEYWAITHEAGVEIRGIVRRRAGDVDEATREWIFQKVEHGEEVARRDKHVVTEPSSNDAVMHDRLVWFILEVAVPPRLEFLERPFGALLKFFLVRSDPVTFVSNDLIYIRVLGTHLTPASMPLVERGPVPLIFHWL